jgi:hypothetical protein
MWKVGGLAVVMVAVVIWLLGCSRESIEEGMQEGTLSAPGISIAVSSLSSLPTSVIINVDTNSYRITLDFPEADQQTGDIPPSDRWCYYVEELPGSQSLSHWVFAVDCLVDPPGEDHIVSSDPPGSEGYDGSTGYYGVKWDLPEAFTSGTFCIYLDAVYPATVVPVVVKTGGGYNVGYIAGPDCFPIVHNDLGQGNGGPP